MSKSRKKKKSITQLTYNVRDYFQSGKVRKLPLGPVFFSEIPTEDQEVIRMILITRQHVNGNKACTTFVIDHTCSLIDIGYYDYNLEMEVIEDIIKEFDLKPYDDYLALHDTILELYAIAKQQGDIKNPEFSIALKILEEDAPDCSKNRSLLKQWRCASSTSK